MGALTPRSRHRRHRARVRAVLSGVSTPDSRRGSRPCPLKSISATFPSLRPSIFARLWAAVAALFCSPARSAGFTPSMMTRSRVKTQPPPANFRSRALIPTSEIAELHRIAADANSRLKTWGWANDQHKLVQMPIERAMQLLAQKGGAPRRRSCRRNRHCRRRPPAPKRDNAATFRRRAGQSSQEDQP